jgi:hypothetical protein
VLTVPWRHNEVHPLGQDGGPVAALSTRLSAPAGSSERLYRGYRGTLPRLYPSRVFRLVGGTRHNSLVVGLSRPDCSADDLLSPEDTRPAVNRR